MSTPPPRSNPVLVTAIIAVVAIFIAVVAAATVVGVAVDDGARSTTLIGLLLGTLAPTIGVLVTLATLVSVNNKVTKVAEQTDDLTNGLMDSKIRAAVSEVVHPDMVNPEVGEQIVADKARRKGGK